jgi:hypothetical protein
MVAGKLTFRPALDGCVLVGIALALAATRESARAFGESLDRRARSIPSLVMGPAAGAWWI